MSRPVIISCAVTGSGDTTGISPYVPVTPEQIASEALAAREAGAAIAHIHVRSPETGKPSRRLDLYQEVVSRIREAKSDVIINLTTGPGARFVPEESDPNVNALPEMVLPEARAEHVVDLRPELCSLDVATMNFGERAFINTRDHITRIAKVVRGARTKPELEVFDLGHVELAKRINAEGVVEAPPLFQLCLGVPWGAPATTEGFLAMQHALPVGAVWSAFGIGAAQFNVVALATMNGGHTRVGLEDNLYTARGELAKCNAVLVERAARIISDLGAHPASPDEAREILALR